MPEADELRIPPGAEKKFDYSTLIPAAIAIAGLYLGRPVLLPLAVAILLAFALSPLVNLLRRWHAGRAFSVIISSLLALAIVGGFIGFVGTQVVSLADDFPRYQSNLGQKIQSIRGMTTEGGVIARATTALQDLREQISGPSSKEPASTANRVTDRTTPREAVPVEIRQPEQPAWAMYTDIITSLLGPAGVAGLIAIFVVFILLHKEDLRDRFIRLAGSRDIKRAKLLLDDSAERLSSYLLSQSAINASFGAAVGTALWLIGMPNPALWGLSVAVFRFVPYFGVPIAAVLPLVVALAIDPGWTKVFWTAAIFFGGEFVVGQAIEPWLLGRNVGLSALAVVVSATFWTWLWGPLGLLLSTPLTTCVMVLGRHIKNLNFLEVMLGDSPPLAAEEALYLRLLGEDAEEAAGEAEDFLKENSLVAYYDEVVLKALALAQTDVSRGTLDREQAGKIRDTTAALIELLSDHHAWEGELDQDLSEGEVVCYAGRGPLDEAAALLLIHLLAGKGIGARLISSNELMNQVPDVDIERLRVVCICFLDPGNFVRARHLLERVRRRFPGKAIIGAFWGFSLTESRYAESAKGMTLDIVTRLEDSLRQIENKKTPAAAKDIEPVTELLPFDGVFAA